MESGVAERTALRRFGDSGMMLLPWTKQILTVLWEQLRLFVQVICCTLMTVFQMFRFEVHVRITDETGQHIQHMTSTSGDPSEGFLLSSLFENNKNIVVGSSSPLSKFSRDPFDVTSHSRAVLSSLVGDDLCCSLVDDLVSHATECLNDTDDLYIGDHSLWKQGYDWTVLGCPERKGTSESSCTFSAHVAGFSKQQMPRSDPATSTENIQSISHLSDSEFSWGSTDSSCLDGEREESDKLWDLLTSSSDPYHPLHFTACLSSAVAEKIQTDIVSRDKGCTGSQLATSSDSSKPGSEDEEEEALWRSLSQNDDPYHPLNFRAPLQSSAASKHDLSGNSTSSRPVRHIQSSRCSKPTLPPTKVARHCCHKLPAENLSLVPWKRHALRSVQGKQKNQPALKKVKFSPIVHVHKMQAWSFALQASRKGPWEELARDRDRFRKRIIEAERVIGYCFSLSHREKLRAYSDALQNI
ncbi:hypothetical protein DNTS_031045 [Danionella cerebrum]|uniref:Protein phosphatase 1 regulatory subunit 15A/B C-terminal domain-containing protein n=1 Tax=Danionella cerebrum TaxID=2873325 RepID=A0A553MYK5_9TELE|nr:hypothetical protein DNTS_031045 [Danionella translucida]